MSDWYFYDWELNGAPARFHVDLSYLEAFDSLGDFTTLLYVSCYSKRSGVSSFSARELRELDAFLADCRKILGAKCAYVGFIDVGAQRRYYFYTPDARLLVSLKELCADGGSLRMACFQANEPNRQTYYRLLVPDSAKKQSVDNESYVRSLEARGDDADAYRRVTLHFYLPGAQARTLFSEQAKSLGFAIGKSDYIAERELPYYLALHAVTQLKPALLTALTTKAIGAAEPYGGMLSHIDSAFVPKRGLFG